MKEKIGRFYFCCDQNLRETNVSPSNLLHHLLKKHVAEVKAGRRLLGHRYGPAYIKKSRRPCNLRVTTSEKHVNPSTQSLTTEPDKVLVLIQLKGSKSLVILGKILLG